MKKRDIIIKDNSLFDFIALGVVVSGIPALIGYVCGTKKGFKRGYEAAVDEIKEAAIKGEITIIDNTTKESDSNGTEEKTEPEQQTESNAECCEEDNCSYREARSEQCDGYINDDEPEQEEEELEEISEELTKSGIEEIEFEDVSVYDELEYSTENFYYYPEDERIANTLINDDGELEDHEIIGMLGIPMEDIAARVAAYAYSGTGVPVLYFANHENMTIYTVETFPGERGVYAEDMFPEIV